MEITIKTLAGAALLPWMIGTKWFAFKDAILHAVLSRLTTRVRPCEVKVTNVEDEEKQTVRV